MELGQIEVLSDLSRLSRVDLFNLLGRAEQLNRRLTAERRRRTVETKSKTGKATDHGEVAVEKLVPCGTWPIMQFKNGQRIAITWFVGPLKNACAERNRLMSDGGDFKIGIRKEDWKHKH